jgi:hypothetical protein
MAHRGTEAVGFGWLSAPLALTANGSAGLFRVVVNCLAVFFDKKGKSAFVYFS